MKTRQKEVGFQVMVGAAEKLHPSLDAGAVGAILAFACFAPTACYEIYAAWKEGDAELARLKQERIAAASQRVVGEPRGSRSETRDGFQRLLWRSGAPAVPAAQGKPESKSRNSWGYKELGSLSKSLGKAVRPSTGGKPPGCDRNHILVYYFRTNVRIRLTLSYGEPVPSQHESPAVIAPRRHRPRDLTGGWRRSSLTPPRSSAKKDTKGASMRDLSRASGMSLAGLYYYFESKERLLFLIQKHTFTTIVQRLKARLEGVSDPEQRIRIFILNHLEYFLANPAAMKVLSHEAEALKNGFASEVAAIKREYYRICVGLLDELKQRSGTAILHAHRGAQPVRHDELDLHVAQPARRCRCGANRAGRWATSFCAA